MAQEQSPLVPGASAVRESWELTELSPVVRRERKAKLLTGTIVACMVGAAIVLGASAALSTRSSSGSTAAAAAFYDGARAPSSATAYAGSPATAAESDDESSTMIRKVITKDEFLKHEPVQAFLGAVGLSGNETDEVLLRYVPREVRHTRQREQTYSPLSRPR